MALGGTVSVVALQESVAPEAQAGRVIAHALLRLPFIASVSPEEQDLLADAEIHEKSFLRERILLCVCAIEATLDDALAPDVARDVRRAFRSTLSNEAALPTVAVSGEILDKLTSYYIDAVEVDATGTNALVDDLSDLECAFGDRLLALGEDNELRGRACVMLSMSLPKVLWSAGAQIAREVLRDVRLLGPDH